MTGDSLVTIASFSSPLEAQLAAGRLRSSGLFVFVKDEHTSRIANHLTPAIGVAKLQVRAEDEAAARALLIREV